MKSPQAAILAIGTELTSGQITNRNAAWLSEKLVNLGVEVMLHEAVPDDRKLMRDALERCTSLSPLVFITGGLGPTSDDFTRDIVAEWLGEKLEFHPSSWDHIVSRLGQAGIRVAESNRQQCFFPPSAEVLPNQEGTANGFFAKRGEVCAWVLPGPPREVEYLWRSSVEPALKRLLAERFPTLKTTRLLTWQCLGKSEAELGEITETALAGSGLATGYRAHRPFVEVKVWVPEDAMAAHQTTIAKLESAIAPWILTRNDEDIGERFLEQIAFADEIEIYDAATAGFLAERLGALLRKPRFANQAPAFDLTTEWTSPASPEEWVAGMLDRADGDTVTLALAGFTSEREWALGLSYGSTRRQEKLQAPWRAAGPNGQGQGLRTTERNQRYAVEVALKRAREWLIESFH